MSSSKLALSFRLFHHGQLVREETLTQSVIKIGKVPSAHLQIADEAVSRMHAIVEITGREVSLIDLGSTRGSFVNDRRINKARLESGDVITVGETRIELTIRDAGAARPTGSIEHRAAAAAAIDRAGAAPPAVPEAARRATASSALITGVSGAIEPAHRATASTAVVSGVIEAAPAAAPVASTAPASATAPHASAARPASLVPPASAAPPAFTATTAPAPRSAALPVVPLAHPPASPVAAELADEGSAAAVEVAAMLGDSVIGVKHCIDPRGGKVAPATWGLVAAGAACLLASAIAFVASVRTAADNHDRLDRWTRIEHKPAYAFRPVRLDPATDWIAFGGAGLALVGLSLGVLRMRRERVSPYYRIGTAPGVELAIEGAPAPAFPLVAPSGDDFVFQFAPGIDGELLQGGSATPLAELAAAGRARPSAFTPGALQVAIPRHARIRARAGGATFLIAAVPRPRRHAVPIFAGLQSRTLAYVAGSLAAHLAIWGILQLLPPDATGISVDLPPEEPISARLQGATQEPPIPPPAEPGQHGDSGGEPGNPTMALPPGASGDPSATDDGRVRIPDMHRTPAMARQDAIRTARESGLLGDVLLASAVDTLSGDLDLASGFDRDSFNGPLTGAYGNGPGNFGGGRAGFGLGGGCTQEPCGLIPGGSRYETIGDGPGGGGNYGLPGRGFGPGRHHPLVPTVGLPRVADGSGYDKTIIRRYIRRSLDKIGYCYDKQLLAHPGIEGEVLVKFFIAPTGAVETSAGTGFDAEVARCVAGVIGSIAFPRPGDGVGVEVNYPFVFHAPAR